MTDYRALADLDLANLYTAGDETVRAAVLKEMARRDRRDAQLRTDKARWARCKNEWSEFARAQYLAAEIACNGYLLSREALAAGMDPFTLWTGSAAHAERFASEELREFWLTNPRLTVSQFHRQQRRDRKESRRAGLELSY